MQKQIPLFYREEHQQPQQKSRSAPVLRGLIQRGLEPLKKHDNWITRTTQLKFKRLEVKQ